jgi:hypothetical protein
MSVFVNQSALERRKLRQQASESASRTINCSAIERRKERLKKQQTKPNKPLEDNVKQAFGEDLFSQIFK